MNVKTFQKLENEWKEKNPLRQFRKKQGLKQQTMAAMMGVSYHVVYRWESGMTEPTEEQLKMMGERIGIENLSEEWSEWIKARPIFEKEK
jgi:DNA-binding transcriptional regulator YiaG